MEKNELKEEIKFLGNKRKLDHDNSEEKDMENNIKSKPQEEKKVDKNKFIVFESPKKEPPKERETENKMFTTEIQGDTCPNCGIKNKLVSFKKGEDIYNYFLTKKSELNEEINKILEEKYKNMEFISEKKICENCLNLFIKDKDKLNQFFCEEKEINPNKNVIKELDINKNIDSNKEVQEIVENKLINNTINNKEQNNDMANIINNPQTQENKNTIDINQNNPENKQIPNLMFYTDKIQQNQNQINPNIQPNINQLIQNNNIPINLQNSDISLDNNLNNINNIQNMINYNNNPNINFNPQNNSNLNNNVNMQIPPQILLNNANLNYQLFNNNLAYRINQLINNNSLYGNANIFNLENNNNNIQNNTGINNNINKNVNKSNINNNNNIQNLNSNANNNNNNNNYILLGNELNSQINSLKECIHVQQFYYEQIEQLVNLFYAEVMKIKQLDEQSKQINNNSFLINNNNSQNNNNININLNPAYILQQQSFQNFFPNLVNIANNNLNVIRSNDLNNLDEGKKEEKIENNNENNDMNEIKYKLMNNSNIINNNKDSDNVEQKPNDNIISENKPEIEEKLINNQKMGNNINKVAITNDAKNIIENSLENDNINQNKVEDVVNINHVNTN